MKRFCISIVAILFFVCGVQACTKSNTSIGGGETNWLKRCTSDADCSEGISCECGICTQSCESNDECTNVRGASSCLVTESLDNGSCRVAAVGESGRGICVARCDTDSDCNEDSDFKCISGICVAIIEEMSSDTEDAGAIFGLIFPNSDAGSSYPLGLNDTRDADRSAYDSSTEPDGSDSAVEESNAIDSGFLGPAMEDVFPQCPCTADIEEGERAPKIEDYPDNAYGGPEMDNRGDFELCHGSESDIVPGFSYGSPYNDYGVEHWGPLADVCFGFSMCWISCAIDADCPRVNSGSAVSRCSFGKACYLDCDFQRTCPDGMTCIRGGDGASCFWATDYLAPDCSTYCASLLVACDPEKGVDCCEGLTCAAEGFCVQE